MGGAAKAWVSRLVLLPLLVVGVGVGAVAPKMLLAKPASKQTHAAGAVKVAKKTASRNKPHPAVPVSKKVSKPGAQMLGTGSSNYYQAALIGARRLYGAGSVSDSAVAVATTCADGYAVVIWTSASGLASTEIYMHDIGSSYQVIAGAHTLYNSSGAVSARQRFGARPSNLSCFQS